MYKAKNLILYVGDTEGVSGYAQAARRTVFCLQDAGINISAKYVKHDTNIIKDASSLHRVRSLYGSHGDIVIHQQIPHMFQPVAGAYNIGFTMFETTKIPDEWRLYLEKMDELWVPSQFNKNVFSRAGLTKPIHVIPFPIDTAVFCPKQKSYDTFRFLSMFQWTERKNWRDLLAAYFTEFSFSENIELYLKVYAASASEYEKTTIQEQINDVIKNVGNVNRPRYVLDFSIKSEKEIAEIFANADIFVMPSCGEAIGLTYLEAMSSGLPCIATGWGGQTEFIDESNGYLVGYSMETVNGMPHIKEYRRDQQWAKVDLSDLRKKMRMAFSEKNTQKRNKARQTVLNRFSMNAVAKLILERLEKLPKIVADIPINVPAITYRGDAFGLSGYSNAIRLMLKCLKDSNISLKLEPVYHDRKQIEKGNVRSFLAGLAKTDVSGKILIDHQTPEFFDTDNKKYKYRIGVTYFETSCIPEKWISQCNKMDEIWLPTEETKNAFESSGVKSKLSIIPPFIDTEHYNPKRKPWNIANKSSLTFLSVFEFIPRKGWDILVEAFAKAFRKSDDVCLVIKTHRNYPPMKQDAIKTAIRDYLHSKNLYEWPKILFFTDPIPYEVMPSLYTACDAFVLPTRGESICYPAMEAMSCGVPCVITAHGGQSSFVNEQNGYLLDYKLVPVKDFNHSPWYTSDQKMAEPNINTLIMVMRHLYNNREELKQKGVAAMRTIELNHSMQNGSEIVLSSLRKICRENDL